MIRIPLKTGVELRCSGRISSSCCTAGTSCVNHYIEERQTTQWPKEKRQTTIYKTLYIKLKIEYKPTNINFGLIYYHIRGNNRLCLSSWSILTKLHIHTCIWRFQRYMLHNYFIWKVTNTSKVNFLIHLIF